MKNKILNFVIAVFIIFGWSGCDKKELEGACKAGKELVSNLIFANAGHPFLQYNSALTPNNNEIYYLYLGTAKVQFFIGKKITNICTKEHLIVNYKTDLTNTLQPESLKVFGEGYWSSYDEEVELHNGKSNINDYYASDLEIGLKQAFNEGPGDIELFLTVEFISQGSLDADKAYFQNHVRSMEISCRFSKSTP